jgi:hypothetical protein
VNDPGVREEFVQVSALECDSIEEREHCKELRRAAFPGTEHAGVDVTLWSSVLEVPSSHVRDTRNSEVISAFSRSLQPNFGIVSL